MEDKKQTECKAMALPRRYQKMCDICLLIDCEDAKMKFHVYEEGNMQEDDKCVCDDCLNGIKEIRKKCGQKIDNPNHNVFRNFMPWFSREIPGLSERFKEAFA